MYKPDSAHIAQLYTLFKDTNFFLNYSDLTIWGHNQLTSDLYENRVYDGNTEDTELAIIMLTVSLFDKDLGDGNFGTPSWHLQRQLCTVYKVNTLSVKGKDDEKLTISVR